MAKKRKKTKSRAGSGSIDERGDGVYRLRYRIGGRRFTQTVKVDTRQEAEDRLLKILGNKQDHVAPSKKTVAMWIDEWLAAGAPGRKKRRVGQRSLERYSQLMNTHVKPALGAVALQKLSASMIDGFYIDINRSAMAPKTKGLLHVVFNSSLATAHRTGEIASNPMARIKVVLDINPQPDDGEAVDTIGEGLSETELAALVEGFKQSSIYPVVQLAAACGARRNELLALRWSDVDWSKKTLRIERQLEQTKKFGVRVKSPKSKRGFRTIDLDDATVAMLRAEHAKHQRWLAGIPGGADVDLGLIRLPPGALIFPGTPQGDEDFDPTKGRKPDHFSQTFADRAEAIGFGHVRFHDLRGCHTTALMDAGIPVHTVAQRIGDDPSILLKHYAKRKRTEAASNALATALASFSAGFLKP